MKTYKQEGPTCLTAITQTKVQAGPVHQVEDGRPHDVEGQGHAKEGHHMGDLFGVHNLGEG